MVARVTLKALREAWAAKMAIEIAASTFIQRVWRGFLGRREAARIRHVREVIFQVKLATATRLQGMLRGWLVRKREILSLSRQIKAATIIQARYRCYATPPIAVFATRMARKRIEYNAAVEAKDREVDGTYPKTTARLIKRFCEEDEEADEWTQF